MIFKYVPILEKMTKLYQKPLGFETRFVPYLNLIQTPDKKDMAMPLAFFNPMAKEYILDKLVQLKAMDFEGLLNEYCTAFSTSGKQIDLYFNLADDIGGGWTTRESTHDLSLKISPYLQRNCGVVVFYASEDITPDLIKERVGFYTDFYNNF
jgi:hypothetical protein